jgi:very-short-patch-repair endonuclease
LGITPREADALIAGLAERQHGIVTRARLIEAGLTSASIKSRVAARWLRPVHRGVYRVGPVRAGHWREMAAVLACGPGAVLSHRSAAALRKLLPRPEDSDPVDVMVPGRDRGRRPGIHARRVALLDPEDVEEAHGIPVTSAARTLLDLGSVAGTRELEQALARAERWELTTRADLGSLVDRRPRHRGGPRIRTLLGNPAGPALTRSEAEERFLALIAKAGLRMPETNVVVARYEVDFLWRKNRLVVEVDGYAFHSSKKRFEGDRRRDADLAARGLRVIRVTWRQIVEEPEAMLVRLAQALIR